LTTITRTPHLHTPTLPSCEKCGACLCVRCLLLAPETPATTSFVVRRWLSAMSNHPCLTFCADAALNSARTPSHSNLLACMAVRGPVCAHWACLTRCFHPNHKPHLWFGRGLCDCLPAPPCLPRPPVPSHTLDLTCSTRLHYRVRPPHDCAVLTRCCLETP
jgi:hypothetical protein